MKLIVILCTQILRAKKAVNRKVNTLTKRGARAAVVAALRKEVKRHDWHGYKVFVANSVPAELVAQSDMAELPAMFSRMCGGMTNSVEEKVTFYLNGIVLNCQLAPWKSVEQTVRETVRHENRHVQQYVLFKADGSRRPEISIFELGYANSLEKDAYRYQSGKETRSVEEVFPPHK